MNNASWKEDALHIHAMRLALEEAEIAREEAEVPIGAVIMQGSEVIARAHNQTITLNDPTAHAEILAITSACNTLHSDVLDRCTLYVTLEPCAMCAGALRWAQIGSIYYAASDPKRGYTCYKPSILHPRTQVMNGLYATEALGLLQAFFRDLR